MWHIVHICSTCDDRTHCMYSTVKVHWFNWYERIDQGQFLQTFSLSDTCFFYAQFYIKSGKSGKSVQLIKTKLLADSQEHLWHPSFVLQELEGESSKHSLYHLPEFTLVLIDFLTVDPGCGKILPSDFVTINSIFQMLGQEAEAPHTRFRWATVGSGFGDGVPHAAISHPPSIALIQPRKPPRCVQLTHFSNLSTILYTLLHCLREV